MEETKVKAKKFPLYSGGFTQFFGIIGLLLVLIIFQITTGGRLLGSRNLMNIFNNFFTIGLGAMAVTFLMSMADLDMSVGAIVGFSAAIGALVGQGQTALILPTAILIGCIAGLVNGILVAKLKVASFIGTLAVSFILRGTTTFLLNGTIGIPLEMRVFDQNAIKISVFLLLLVFFWVLFNRTAFGKRCRSIGSSMEAARQSGVRVDRVRIIAFLISGVVCGLIGFFSLVRSGTASSTTGSAFEFDVLLAVLLGGMPLSGGWGVKFQSAVVGSIAMALMKSGMSLMGINGLTQQLIQGILLILIASLSFDRKTAVVIK